MRYTKKVSVADPLFAYWLGPMGFLLSPTPQVVSQLETALIGQLETFMESFMRWGSFIMRNLIGSWYSYQVLNLNNCIIKLYTETGL
jgi:hypothetical protein